ncbi:MAG TPA: phage tail protein [Pyrinomonadaceae bacterium]|nr:phage tail protein [Pyrinomonadaceae bacterium]
MAQTGSRNDPFAGFNFLVEIDGITVAGFSEITGLINQTDVIEYRTGNNDISVTKLPGLKKFNNITLKHGMTDNTELWEWRKTVLNGKTERKSGSIVLQTEARTEAMRWNFYETWVSKMEVSAFNAKTNDVALLTVELVCERVELV